MARSEGDAAVSDRPKVVVFEMGGARYRAIDGETTGTIERRYHDGLGDPSWREVGPSREYSFSELFGALTTAREQDS